MSAPARAPRPATRPAPRPSAPARPAAARPVAPRPALAVVPPHQRSGRAPFVLLVVTILSGGLMGLLALNTALAQGSFTVGELQRQTAELDDRSQALEQELARAQSPERLAIAARKIGMVPELDPAFIRLSDGTITGKPTRADEVTRPLTKQERAARKAENAAKRAADAEQRAAKTAEEKAAAEKAAAEKAIADAKKAEAAAKKKAEADAKKAEQAWKDKLAAQEAGDPRSGGETVLEPPDPKGKP